MPQINKEQLVKIIKNHKWWVQVFNGLPLYLHTVASNTGWMIKPVAGVNYSHFFLRIHEHRAHYYYDEDDLARIGAGYYKKNKNIQQLYKLIRRHKTDYLNAKRLTGKIIIDDLPSKDLAELVNLGQRLCKELTMAIGIVHSVEGISYVSERKLHAMLEKRGADNQENFQLLSAPVYPSFLSLAQSALWKIKVADKHAKTNLIDTFLNNFGWIENSYVLGKTLTPAEILKKAGQQKHQPSPTALAKTKSEKARLIKKLRLSKAETFVIGTIETSTHWQDERKKLLMMTIGRFEPVITELAKRLKLKPEMFKYIYSKELTFKNLTDKNFIAELKFRYPKSCYYALKNEILIYPGPAAIFIEKQLEEKNDQSITELKGMIACQGVVRGRIKICKTIHDIPKVKKGEILVASMTRPEFLPAMQKAAAFVTDEGGITSHASIISREMNKPCIIGTKIATRVFKDGDLVEVNADHGWVKKL